MRKPQRPPLPKRTSINLEPYLAKLESLRDRDTGWAAMSASKLAEFLLALGLDVSEQASIADALKQLESGQRPSEADLNAIARDYKLDRAFLGELCDRLLS